MLTAVIGSLITLGAFLAGVIFKMGHHSARLEQLEIWRANMRLDMHEISDKLEHIAEQVAVIAAMLERRQHERV